MLKSVVNRSSTNVQVGQEVSRRIHEVCLRLFVVVYKHVMLQGGIYLSNLIGHLLTGAICC